MITITARTATGPFRNQNQDRVWADASRKAGAVLDGCGASGQIADLLVKAIAAHIEASAPVTTIEQLHLIYTACNSDVVAAMRRDNALRGGGTTLDAIIFSESRLLALHIGDGRIYRVRADRIEQLSSDHRLVAEMVARGEISELEAAGHPHGNVVTRAVTGSPSDTPDLIVSDVLPGDIFFACTDGVWSAVRDTVLLRHFRDRLIVHAIEIILSEAEVSHDNASIVAALVM